MFPLMPGVPRTVSSILSLHSVRRVGDSLQHLYPYCPWEGGRSLRHFLDDAGKTVDCLRHVLFDVVAGTVFSTFSLVLGGSRTIFSMSAVIPGSGRARDSLHSQHVNSDAKRAGDSFQQHHGYRIPWIASTPFCVGTGPRQLPLVQYLFVKHHVFSRADSNVRVGIPVQCVYY